MQKERKSKQNDRIDSFSFLYWKEIKRINEVRFSWNSNSRWSSISTPIFKVLSPFIFRVFLHWHHFRFGNSKETRQSKSTVNAKINEKPLVFCVRDCSFAVAFLICIRFVYFVIERTKKRKRWNVFKSIKSNCIWLELKQTRTHTQRF